MNESNGTVLDILIYVFDHYMLTEAVIVPERDELTLDLERAGFALEQVEQALDWLADLASERSRPTLEGDGRAMRVFTESAGGRRARRRPAQVGRADGVVEPTRRRTGLFAHGRSRFRPARAAALKTPTQRGNAAPRATPRLVRGVAFLDITFSLI